MKDSTDLQKGETNMNHRALDNRTKEDNPESQGKAKIIKSTGIGGKDQLQINYYFMSIFWSFYNVNTLFNEF